MNAKLRALVASWRKQADELMVACKGCMIGSEYFSWRASRDFTERADELEKLLNSEDVP